MSDDHVAVHLSGLDTLWAGKSRLILGIEDVVSARVVERNEAVEALGWRLIGANVPRVAKAGTFSIKDRPGERAFASVYRDERVLVIETRLERPRLVILQHRDAHELAWLIGERVG